MTGTKDEVNFSLWTLWNRLYAQLKQRGEPATPWQMRRLLVQTNMRARSILKGRSIDDFLPIKEYRYFSHVSYDLDMNQQTRVPFLLIYSYGMGIYSNAWNIIPCGSRFEWFLKTTDVEEDVDTGADIVKVANTPMDDEGITEILRPVTDEKLPIRHRFTSHEIKC
ncbi:hypothetical protein NCAS_0F01690 [Naumovozyma castellii]|uniref:Uncharacterized protein n=1 Tax=Naumovozyma castellii TaxID=27288 RepID=G0VGN2_NAUCA|nr:hypothetical protein NCAS_0F01690 [Naumovozyma castellii CBS 4309]CCC70653.1 hypothetical protein NCAS_0F01690 [Naumovozyma castellii CBS 4309]